MHRFSYIYNTNEPTRTSLSPHSAPMYLYYNLYSHTRTFARAQYTIGLALALHVWWPDLNVTLAKGTYKHYEIVAHFQTWICRLFNRQQEAKQIYKILLGPTGWLVGWMIAVASTSHYSIYYILVYRNVHVPRFLFLPLFAAYSIRMIHYFFFISAPTIAQFGCVFVLACSLGILFLFFIQNQLYVVRKWYRTESHSQHKST